MEKGSMISVAVPPAASNKVRHSRVSSSTQAATLRIPKASQASRQRRPLAPPRTWSSQTSCPRRLRTLAAL